LISEKLLVSFNIGIELKYLERGGTNDNHMVGKYASSLGLENNALSPRIYYVPLMFWFCRNPGLSLPLIALQYHEVKIVMEFRDANELIVGLLSNSERDYDECTTQIADGGLSLQTAALWVD
jgi:hypothetical protein